MEFLLDKLAVIARIKYGLMMHTDLPSEIRNEYILSGRSSKLGNKSLVNHVNLYSFTSSQPFPVLCSLTACCTELLAS